MRDGGRLRQRGAAAAPQLAERGGVGGRVGGDSDGPGGGPGVEFVQGRAGAVPDGQPGGQPLQDGEAEGLLRRGGGQHVHRGEEFGHVVALAREVQPGLDAKQLGPADQHVPLRARADQQQPGLAQRRVLPAQGDQLGQRVHQQLEPLAGDEPPDRADHPGLLRQPEFGPDGLPQGGPGGGRQAVAVGLDTVRQQVHPGRRHPPVVQRPGHLAGDRDGGGAEPLGGQVERLDARGDGPALDHARVQRVLGRHHPPDTGQPGRQAAVEARPVEVGVDEVVLARADQPGEAGQYGEIPVAAHPQVVDGDALGAQRGGDGARVGEGRHLAVVPLRQVAQHQLELALGAAGGEPRDDVQDSHPALRRRGTIPARRRPVSASRTRCRPRLARSRQAPSRSPT